MKIKIMLKKSLKFLFVFLVKLCQSLLSVFFIITKTNLRNHIPLIKDAGSLTILANGPSLKDEIDKLDLTSCELSVLNDFYKSPKFRMLRPKYYVLADPLYVSDKESINGITQNLDWEMVLFVPFSFLKKAGPLRDLSCENVRVIPYNSNTYQGFECLRNFFYKKGLAMPRAQNVLVASIFTGINMGYKEINIYGADHSWTQTLGVNEMNQVCAIDSHFYDKEKVKYLPYNCMKMHELLRAFAFMFESYHYLRNYADSIGCRIINCTKGSFIDAFERA